MTEPVSQCRLQSIRVKKGEVWFKKEEVTTIIYLLDIIVPYKKVHGSWLTLFMMSPLMFGIGISLSTSSSMSKTMAIACRRYKGEREAGCEQVILYFNKIFLRHWLISIFIFFQSSTKRWLPLTYHQAYLRLCRTSVRVATALCAVDLKGSGGPGKGNVSVDWERSLKKEEKYSIMRKTATVRHGLPWSPRPVSTGLWPSFLLQPWLCLFCTIYVCSL